MRHEDLDTEPVAVTKGPHGDRERIETPDECEARLDAEQAHEDYIRRCEWLLDYQETQAAHQ